MSAFIEWMDENLWVWQLAWIKDHSRFKIVKKPRQVGFTDASVLAALLHCAYHSGHTYYLVSTTRETASKELLRRVKNRFLPMLQAAGIDIKATSDSAYVLELSNGSRLEAVSYDPDRLRGKTRCSFLLDEFAFWPTRIHEGLLSAIWPIVENSSLNPHGQIVVVSTPFSTEDLYHDIWTDKDSLYSHWSRHDWDIYSCVAADPKFIFDIEEKRSRTSQEVWETEYEGKFKSFGNSYFSRSQLESCAVQKPLKDDAANTPQQSSPTYERFLGLDLGKVNDFSALVVMRKYEDGSLEVESSYSMRTLSYDLQYDIFKELIGSIEFKKIEVDATMHPSFADFLIRDFGSSKVVARKFTLKWKTEQTQELKKKVEQSEISFSFDNSHLYEGSAFKSWPSRPMLSDLLAVNQELTASRKVTFKVKQTKDGHGDTYSAILLALSASKKSSFVFVL